MEYMEDFKVMSISYYAVIVVGLRREEYPEDFDFEKHYDEDDLTEVSSYYDGGGQDENVIGLIYAQTDEYSAEEIIFNNELLQELKVQFTKITGLEGRLYLSPWGS